jgi:putative ABC transport system substrate-binding protein
MRDRRSRVSRRAWLAFLAAGISLPPGRARAQRPTALRRVGWLSYLSSPDPILDSLREGLRELGYVEGKSVVIVPRFAHGDFTRLPQLVEELARERVDVVVSRGPSSDYTKVLRSRVPVVFIYSGDPVAAGFADSLNRPGRNMTGITMMALELSAKRVDVLKELVPRASRIALLSNPEHAGELDEYRVTEEAARRLGASITRYLVKTPQDLAAMYAEIRSARPDAMIVFPDSLTLLRRAEIAEFAARERIPTMYGWSEFVESGGLVSYGPRLADNFKTLAQFVDKILKGASANTLPIEQASRIGLILNMAAARNIGLAVPQSILLRADRVIE